MIHIALVDARRRGIVGRGDEVVGVKGEIVTDKILWVRLSVFPRRRWGRSPAQPAREDSAKREVRKE